MFDEERHIPPPILQRRDFNRYSIQPKIQVFPKRFFLHPFEQITPLGSNQWLLSGSPVGALEGVKNSVVVLGLE